MERFLKESRENLKRYLQGTLDENAFFKEKDMTYRTLSEERLSRYSNQRPPSHK